MKPPLPQLGAQVCAFNGPCEAVLELLGESSVDALSDTRVPLFCGLGAAQLQVMPLKQRDETASIKLYPAAEVASGRVTSPPVAVLDEI